MKRNPFLQLIIIAVLLFCANLASAAPVDPQKARSWAEDKGSLLLTSFKDDDIARRYQTLDQLFIDYVDLDYISRFVVGKYWRTMTTEQQAAYLKVFKRYVLAVYKTFPLEFANSLRYEVSGATVDGQFTVVSALIYVKLGEEAEPKSFLLQFRLHEKEGMIKLVDIKLTESSLILAYRNRFYEMISQNDGDITWFTEDLTDLADAIEQSNTNRIPQVKNY